MSEKKMTIEQAIYCLEQVSCADCKYDMVGECNSIEDSCKEAYHVVYEAFKAQLDKSKTELQSKIIVSLKSGKVIEVDNPHGLKSGDILDMLSYADNFMLFCNHILAIDQIESIEVRE